MPEKETMLILYDGNCPVCCRKKLFLERHDKHHRLRFIDIHSDSMDSLELKVGYADLEKQIHAILPDGSVINRMDVIRAAWHEIGLGWLVAPTGWPILRQIFDLLYAFVAKNRSHLSRFLLLKKDP